MQAGLCLTWSQPPEDMFSHGPAHINLRRLPSQHGDGEVSVILTKTVNRLQLYDSFCLLLRSVPFNIDSKMSLNHFDSLNCYLKKVI